MLEKPCPLPLPITMTVCARSPLRHVDIKKFIGRKVDTLFVQKNLSNLGHLFLSKYSKMSKHCLLDFLLKHENQDRKSFVWPKLDINVG